MRWALLQGLLQLLDLAFMLGNFLKTSGDLLFDLFLACFGHRWRSFAVGTHEVSVWVFPLTSQSATGLLCEPALCCFNSQLAITARG